MQTFLPMGEAQVLVRVSHDHTQPAEQAPCAHTAGNSTSNSIATLIITGSSLHILYEQ